MAYITGNTRSSDKYLVANRIHLQFRYPRLSRHPGKVRGTSPGLCPYRLRYPPMDPPVVMTPRKRGHKWEITYRIPGYTKTFSERFETEEEAILRCAEIAVAKKEGTLTPPVKGRKVKPITVSQLMDEFVYTYGTSHWGESYLSLAKHRVEHYIKPYLGYYLVKHITPALLEQYYSDLLTRPAVHMKGHRHTSTVSFDVMEKCHSLIRSSLNMAVRWGYINHNPAEYVILPNRPMSRPREVWDPETARRALDCCEDPVLRLCMLLSIACSLRIGEILGLQWKNVHLYENKLSYLEVRQELKHRRVRSGTEETKDGDQYPTGISVLHRVPGTSGDSSSPADSEGRRRRLLRLRSGHRPSGRPPGGTAFHRQSIQKTDSETPLSDGSIPFPAPSQCISEAPVQRRRYQGGTGGYGPCPVPHGHSGLFPYLR